MSHTLLADRPNRLRWDPDAARELFGFGRWIFASTMIMFMANQVDRLALGRLSTLGQVGLYTTALSLAQVPRAVFQRLADAVVYPVLAAVVHRPDGPARVVMVRRVLLIASAPPCAAMLVLARPVVGLLFDPRYAMAGDYLGLLMVGTWFQGIHHSYRGSILAAGAPGYMAAGYALRLAIFIGLAPLLYVAYGVMGIAAASVVSELGVVALCTYGAARLGVASIASDTLSNAAFAASVLGAAIAYMITARASAPVNSIIWAIVGAGAATILTTAITLAVRQLSPQVP